MITIPKLDILCIGMAVMDTTFLTEHHPEPDEKLKATQSFSSPGGPAATAAATAASLGSSTGLICALGKDPAADFLMTQWQLMQLEQVFQMKANQTASACVILKPNGERTVVNSEATPKKTKKIKLEGAAPKYILCDGRLQKETMKFIEACKQLGSKVILDAGSINEGTLNLLPLSDYLISSQKFALSYTNLNDSRAALRILSQNAQHATITLGSEGTIAQDQESFEAFSAHSIEVINTNNAGDVFHGAFCHALIEEAHFFEAIEYANEIAAHHCSHKNIIASLKSLRGD
jgi:sulfofructose kinase